MRWQACRSQQYCTETLATGIAAVQRVSTYRKRKPYRPQALQGCRRRFRRRFGEGGTGQQQPRRYLLNLDLTCQDQRTYPRKVRYVGRNRMPGCPMPHAPVSTRAVRGQYLLYLRTTTSTYLGRYLCTVPTGWSTGFVMGEEAKLGAGGSRSWAPPSTIPSLLLLRTRPTSQLHLGLGRCVTGNCQTAIFLQFLSILPYESIYFIFPLN